MLNLIFAFLPERFSRWLDVPIHGNPYIIINLVAVLLLLFFVSYVWSALKAWFNLWQAVRTLSKNQSEKSAGIVITKDELGQVFSNRFFSSSWKSFSDTLHEQYEYQGGQRQLIRIRSTMPAEAIFSPQSLVDSKLNVEFFKHLPGILTGIGIIGTFYGLIHGIQQFDPSLLAKAKADPAQMEKLFGGLKILFVEVQGAFIASFFAIGAAMLVTTFEKWLLNVCYRRLEELCRALDELYDGGVGEDYLASLVKSSAESSTQTRQLKESLVTELSELLRELTTQQVEQTKALGELLATKIQEQIESGEKYNESLSTTLKNGLENIGEKVANVTNGQSDTMTGMLDHLIHTFSTNIQNTVGGQMRGLTDMMNSTIASMAEMQNSFKELLQDLRESGKAEREDLTAKVISLVSSLEAQQDKLESQTAAFIETIKGQISVSQQETMIQVRESLNEIQGSVGKILSDMEKERIEIGLLERERQQDFVNTSKHLMAEMGTQIGSLVEHNQKAVDSIGEKVSAQLNESLTATHTTMGKLLADIEQDRRISASAEREQHQTFVNMTERLVTDMQAQIGDLIKHITKTVDALNNNVTAINQTSMVAIDKMNEGASRITVATNNFAEAGKTVSSVMTQSERVSNLLSQSANQLNQASASLDGMLREYAATRDAISKIVIEIKGMLERAKKEAGINQKIVDDMRQTVESFGILKGEMDSFVESITKLLAETMAKFRSDMATHNAEFHKHHADTLNQVASAYEPLAAAIGGLSEMVAIKEER